MAKHMILADGILAIGGVDLGLTRGGGSFRIEREYREIQADCDMGPVIGRIRKIRSVAKLQMNMLEIDDEFLDAFAPATSVDTTTVVGTTTWTGKQDIELGDYQDLITWTGKTKEGESVIITLEKAINLENIEWNMVSKEEIVPTVTYTAVYTEANRHSEEGEPWSVDFVGA